MDKGKTRSYFIPVEGNKAALRILIDRLKRNPKVFADFGFDPKNVDEKLASVLISVQQDFDYSGPTFARLSGLLRVDQITVLTDERLAEILYCGGITKLVKPHKKQR